MQREQRLRATGCGDELDGDRVSAVQLDHRAEIATAQPVVRHVVFKNDDVEQLWSHFVPPGYAVTNRGRSSPVRMHQMLTTGADAPFGPIRIARMV